MKIIVGNTYAEILKKRYFIMIILPFLWTFGLLIMMYVTEEKLIYNVYLTQIASCFSQSDNFKKQSIE